MWCLDQIGYQACSALIRLVTKHAVPWSGWLPSMQCPDQDGYQARESCQMGRQERDMYSHPMGCQECDIVRWVARLVIILMLDELPRTRYSPQTGYLACDILIRWAAKACYRLSGELSTMRYVNRWFTKNVIFFLIYKMRCSHASPRGLTFTWWGCYRLCLT